MMLISFDRIRKNQGLPQVITKQQLDQLGSVYIQRIQLLDQKINIMSLENSLVYDITKNFDASFYEYFIKKKFEDSEVNKLRFIAHSIKVWTNGVGNKYEDEHLNIQCKFLTDEEAKECIEKCIRNKRIRELSELSATRVAAYWLIRFDKLNDSNFATEEICKEKLTEWNYYPEFSNE